MQTTTPLPLPRSRLWQAGFLTCFVASALQANAAQTFSPGFLKLEVYTEVPGITVEDLRWDPKFPDFPDEIHYVTRFEIPPSKYVPGNGGGIAVGQRLSGFIVPDQTGDYVFYMSANEAGELWLASDPAQPEAIELIAMGTANIPARSYDVTTPSGPIHLVAGERYYVEALMKEEGKEDLMAVAWTKEGEPPPPFLAPPIPGRNLGILTDTDGTPPDAVSDLAVDESSLGISYLWLNWTAPADQGSAAAADYDLRFSTTAITAANWTNATPLDTVFFFPGAPGNIENFKAVALSPNTHYYFAVRAKDAAGNRGPISNLAQGQTQAAVAGDFEVIWDLEFNTDGEDPTAKGDWNFRSPGQTAVVADGLLKCATWTPILDTVPKDNFNQDFIVDLRMRCVTPLAESVTYDGACFFVNMDANNGNATKLALSLALLEDGTQRLNLMVNDAVATSFPGLSADFQNVRVEFEPVFKRLRVTLNGVDQGLIDYDPSQVPTDDRYASILGWGAEAEWDYVRIGRPVRTMDSKWELTFDKAGEDPTAKGDWKFRNPDQFADVADGLLKCVAWTPILDTVPKDDFNYPFIVETRLRCVTPLVGTPVYDGACLFINMDASGGMATKMAFSLQLLEDGTQNLNFVVNDSVLTNFPGLSTDFHTVRLEFEPAKQQFHAFLDGSDAGVLTYLKGEVATDDRYASILGWGADAEFDYARVGVPISSTVELNVSLTPGVVLSWPVSAAGFVLESSPTMAAGTWTTEGAPTVEGDLNVLRPTVTGNSVRFFRLRK